MMKRFTLAALVLSLTMLASLRTLAYDFEVDGLYYNIESTVNRTVSLTYKESVKINGYYAGYNDYSKEELVIPSSVEYMGQTLSLIGVDIQAFEYNTAIQKVIIPPTIQWLHQECFDGCTSLSEVIIEDSDTPLQFYMKGRSFYFDECPITTLYIGRNIILPSNIGRTPFAQLNQLKDVSFSENVTYIVKEMFSQCPSLETISLPPFCTEIQEEAFSQCSKLTSVNNTSLISKIGDKAFYNCSNLTEFKCNDLLTLGQKAFQGCSSLFNIEIGNSLTIIPEYAFDGCTNLSTFSIPTGVTTISSYAFQNCTALGRISFPANVSSIKNYAFNGCSSLQSLKIEYSEEPLDLWNLFLWKSDKENKIGVIEYLEINRDLKSTSGRFFYFSDIKEVVIGPNVKSIDSVFELTLATGLESISVYAEVPPTTSWFFRNDLLTTVKVYVPKGTKEAYQNSNHWKGFWNIIDDLTTSISNITVNNDNIIPRYYLFNGIRVNTPPVNQPYIKIVGTQVTKHRNF